MRRTTAGEVVYSPSDLIRYLGSPFASWMDRYDLEHPGTLAPDETSAEQQLIMDSGLVHERTVLQGFTEAGVALVTIVGQGFTAAHEATSEAIAAGRLLIYQGALKHGRFQGYADFIERDGDGTYTVWDTKFARSPKPYYVIQLCGYSEMLAELTGTLPDHFGVILGTHERVTFRLQEFIHYYRRVKASMLAMQDAFTGRIEDRPEPLARADHGRWSSHAEAYFEQTDHLVRVANISVGQIKKLGRAGITTMTQLAAASGTSVPKLNGDTLEKLAAQARLQCATLERRSRELDAPPEYEVLPPMLRDGRANALATLPEPDPADVFFDMEGYPLVPGGLEYLFGLVTRDDPAANSGRADYRFHDWWAHDRDEEKKALEGFVDFVYARWRANPGMHIYHYAAYEVSAVRRLSTRHDTRQDEVDDLLRAGVFVDLYQTVCQSLMIGEDSYSIKRVEHLYRGKRQTDVATAVDSIVQYAVWLASDESREPGASTVLTGIRDYNEDDCRSTVELRDWLLRVAEEQGLREGLQSPNLAPTEERVPSPEVLERAVTAERLRRGDDHRSLTLADVLDYHRREAKPMWWRLFDRAAATEEELRDDAGCIAGIDAVGEPEPVARSQVQRYVFDPEQECKLAGTEQVYLAEDISRKFRLEYLDLPRGRLALKLSNQALDRLGGFPAHGSLLPDEFVNPDAMVRALELVARDTLAGQDMPASLSALLDRRAPQGVLVRPAEDVVAAARRITAGMDGDCLVVQGPPGTGKTYTASQAIAALLTAGKRVGITSNSHKAVMNLMRACGERLRGAGVPITGVKAGGDEHDTLFGVHPGIRFVKQNGEAHRKYDGGIIGGTAWLFSRPEWVGELDYLFIDEAGQVPLANAVAVAPSARNLVLLGDQMQLEQPVQGSHPGDAGMSVLQYALKDEAASAPDAPVFYPVIPADKGLFLRTSRRMHPAVCTFISEVIYEGRLAAHVDCERQRIDVQGAGLIESESGIVFLPVEHEGNVQRSDEEVERVRRVLDDLLGRDYTDKEGVTRPLALDDFLFIAPYNAQVRALKDALPAGAKVGSVDKFQGQEAPVCVLSLCSSAGEYGSRGLGFILDRNRVNVGISRAKCLAVVVGDPRIADTLPGSIEEMRVLGMYCRVVGA